MTAIVTFRLNTLNSTCLYCYNKCGKYLYYYDYNNIHYTCLCDSCVTPLITNNTKYVEDNRKRIGSEYITKYKIFRNVTCRCGSVVSDYAYEYNNTMYCHKCFETILYHIRTNNKQAYITVGFEDPVKKYNGYHTLCSVCSMPNFNTWTWQYMNFTGICENCLQNLIMNQKDYL